MNCVSRMVHTVCVQLRGVAVEDGHGDAGFVDGVLQEAVGRRAAGLHQKLRVTLHGVSYGATGETVAHPHEDKKRLHGK